MRLIYAALVLEPIREQLRPAIQNGEIGTELFITLAREVKRGTFDLSWIVKWLKTGSPDELKAKLEQRSRARRKAKKIKLSVYVPRDLVKLFRRGLLLFALRNGMSMLDQALLGVALREAQDGRLPKWAEPYRYLIDQGLFYCDLCTKIPRDESLVVEEIDGRIRIACGPKCKQTLHELSREGFLA